PAVLGERAHRTNDRAEPGDDPGPEIVAVGEAARNEHAGDAVERRLLVPQDDGLGAGDLERVHRIDIPVRAREDDDADPDGHPGAPTREDVAPSTSMSNDSISGFDSSSEASRSTTARAAGSESAVTVSSIRRPTRTAETPSIPRWPRLPSTARPWGSRMPSLGRTFTANRTSTLSRPPRRPRRRPRGSD